MDVDLALIATPEDTVIEMGLVIVVNDYHIFPKAARLNGRYSALQRRCIKDPLCNTTGQMLWYPQQSPLLFLPLLLLMAILRQKRSGWTYNLGGARKPKRKSLGLRWAEGKMAIRTFRSATRIASSLFFHSRERVLPVLAQRLDMGISEERKSQRCPKSKRPIFK
jgi:hypothetical protein